MIAIVTVENGYIVKNDFAKSTQTEFVYTLPSEVTEKIDELLLEETKKVLLNEKS